MNSLKNKNAVHSFITLRTAEVRVQKLQKILKIDIVIIELEIPAEE